MILLIGNMDAVSMALADSLSKREKVLVADGVLPALANHNIIISETLTDEQDVEYIFDTYSFDTVLFVPPRHAQMASSERGGYAQLLSVLRACDRSRVRQTILLSSSMIYAEEDAREESGRVNDTCLCALLNACEALCDIYREERTLNVTVLHVPSLFSDKAADGLLADAVDAIRRQKNAVLPGKAQATADFLHVDDLADFLFRFHDEPLPSATQPVINLPGTGDITFEKLADWLRLAYPNAHVETWLPGQDAPADKVAVGSSARPFALRLEKKTATAEAVRPARYPVQTQRQTARRQYDWQAYITPMDRMETLLPELHDGAVPRVDASGKVRHGWKKSLLTALELLLGWALAELLQRLVSGSMLLGFLDCRLLFVVIIAMVHGMRPGILAALCVSVSYAVVSILGGARWQMLFLNFSNWLPALAYFLTAAVVGYTKNRLLARNEEERERRAAIEEKYVFLYDLYNKSLEIKEKLKDQILGYADGYGRFFKAVELLDRMLPNEIYRNAIRCMEDFLDNRSVAIYSVDPTAHYARLQMNSPAIASALKASYDLSAHPEMLERVGHQRVFCNQTFSPDEPAFCGAVYDKDAITAVIMLWSALPEQYSADYINRIHVMIGLVQIAVVRALDYLRAVESERYLPGTHIMRDMPFAELCKLYRETRENEMAKFCLLRLCTELPIAQLDGLIQTSIRRTDTVGVDQDGTVCILLAQADETGVEIIQERLEKKGVHCKQGGAHTECLNG